MTNLTEKQLDKINTHLTKMTEAQQDAYLAKLDEAGINPLKSILSKLGSVESNKAKFDKNKASLIKQLGNIKNIIGKAANVPQADVQKDLAAVNAIINKVNAVSFPDVSGLDAPEQTQEQPAKTEEN